jgi:hypothetical protein
MRTPTTVAAVAALSLAAACAESTSGDTGPATVGAGNGMPAVSVTCPGGIFVSASEHGPVFINGAEASLNTFSDTYWEASGSGIIASITRNPDDTASVTYTGPGGDNGICS